VGFFDRLRDGLSRTKQQIVGRFEEIVQQADTAEQRTRPIDVDTVEALEELLISADVGIPATERIVTAVRSRARHGESLRDLVRQEILQVFDGVERPSLNGHTPHVTLIVGVNGTGKTTTVGKLANLFKAQGKQPLVCAADTFRAAAVEQLEIWATRAGVDIIRAKEGADPAALVFDAIQSGKAKGRTDDKQIILYKNQGGQGIVDIALAKKCYELAKEHHKGYELRIEPRLNWWVQGGRAETW